MECPESAKGVSKEIGALQTLDLSALRHRWRVLTGRKLPKQLPLWLARRMVAYRLQANAFGELDMRTVRILDRITQHLDRGGDVSTLASLGLSSRIDRALRAGTVLVREHDGINHHVMVLDDGFTWNGATYRSLSEVARAITGTRWNGYRFFGLKSKNAWERPL